MFEMFVAKLLRAFTYSVIVFAVAQRESAAQTIPSPLLLMAGEEEFESATLYTLQRGRIEPSLKIAPFSSLVIDYDLRAIVTYRSIWTANPFVKEIQAIRSRVEIDIKTYTIAELASPSVSTGPTAARQGSGGLVSILPVVRQKGPGLGPDIPDPGTTEERKGLISYFEIDLEAPSGEAKPIPAHPSIMASANITKYTRRYAASPNGEVQLVIGVPATDTVPLGVRLPESQRGGTQERLGELHVLTKGLVVLGQVGLSKPYSSGLRATPATFSVLNRASGRWNSFTLPSPFVTMSPYGKFLAGHLRRRPSLLARPLENPLTDNRATGFPYERRFALVGDDPPGQLWIYDVERGKLLWINTTVPDSEILLIHADLVYYRVGDGIWVASVAPDGLGRSTLLVRDMRLLDVHWALPIG